MSTSIQEFLRSIDDTESSLLDRALAILWWISRDDPSANITANEICKEVEALGHPKQNSARLAQKLKADPRATKAGSTGWKLHPRARRELDELYADRQTQIKPLPQTDSVLPILLFQNTRSYIVRVVEQVNKSYDVGLWDCCAVMCRRLLETLIIEAYEAANRVSDIKGSDGHFYMLNGLITCLENDASFHLGRSASRGLKDFKQLGDLSAHNRRFNARRDDIDRVRDGLRIATEELVHLAGFSTAP
jgi:hypothetical protein